MTEAIFHFARWLAWQLADRGARPSADRPASITVISAGAED